MRLDVEFEHGADVSPTSPMHRRCGAILLLGHHLGGLQVGTLLSDHLAGLAGVLRSALVGAGLQVREVMQDLTAALGEPPRRPFEEPGSGGGLSWAVGAAVVCGVLAARLCALSFAAMPGECEAWRPPAAGPRGPEDDQEEEELVVRPITKIFRLLLTVICPAFFGSLLNIKHTLVPALLCGA
ncbi:unnamed protein product [Prorocentrum cordatum]|uniref:Uncharacterized protein n=1 Tax=Prorocentrum cordatum TaxID=2364126 RepID=A0ABN9TL60_9DINO|nr:unnamed protein product [Polarella glacialis]